MTSSVVGEDFWYIRDRQMPFKIFDADNHLYETRDALTKFIPEEYEGIIRYVEVEGRTKIAIADMISNYIPNPTFARVAVPGSYGRDVSRGGRDRSFAEQGISEETRMRARAMPGMSAFFDPEPRLELMMDMGIDRTLLWPTLASVVEERLADDPDAACAVVHALNEWMYEHWSFNYQDAIYPTPIISLAVLDKAVSELQRVHERGAKIFLLRVAPVPTWKGRRSFALKEFDPFWELVQELDMAVGMHGGDPGYQRYINDWEGLRAQEFRAFSSNGSPAFIALMSEKSPLIDALASIIGHGLATRVPSLRFAPVEYPSSWIRPFVAKLRATYEASPAVFDEDPFDVFKRNIWVHCFHEPDPGGLLEIGIPADHLMFGSDFPHPEGMADPLAYSDVVKDLPVDVQSLIMGGSLARMMRIAS